MVQSEVEILKAEMKQLMAQKSTIEGDIAERTARLNAPGQPGLTGSLMDKEVLFPMDGCVLCSRINQRFGSGTDARMPHVSPQPYGCRGTQGLT